MRGSNLKSRRIRSAAALAVLGGFATMVPGPAAATELALRFEGAPAASGQLYYAVHASEAGWRSRKAPVASGTAPWTGGSLAIRLDLPPGKYAVMAYHDRNANGRLDTLPIGLPTEPYGFSGKSRGVFGPPPWASAAVTLDGRPAAWTIRLR